ncbi:MAG: hypothetical protein Q4G46_14910 [Propionibacteriaceae bacterium]|nr:hypothetical protein [Propionibacteriaceae bacterium]
MQQPDRHPLEGRDALDQIQEALVLLGSAAAATAVLVVPALLIYGVVA